MTLISPRHVIGYVVAWFSRAFAVPVRIREGLVHLKSARYTTLTCQSDPYRFRALMFCCFPGSFTGVVTRWKTYDGNTKSNGASSSAYRKGGCHTRQARPCAHPCPLSRFTGSVLPWCIHGQFLGFRVKGLWFRV